MELIRSIIGGAGGVLDTVKRLITAVISALWDHVHNAFEVIWKSIHRGWDFANAVWNNVLGLAQQLYATADNIVNGIIRQLREWAAAAFDAARHALDGLAGFVNHAIDSLWHGIRDVVSSVTRWALDNIWHPLVGQVAEVRGWVGDIVEWFRRYAGALARFVDRWLGSLLRWLDDPIGETTRWVAGMFHAAPAVLLSLIVNAMRKEGDKVADIVEKTVRY